MYAKASKVSFSITVEPGQYQRPGRRGDEAGPLVRLPGELRSETRGLLEDQTVVDEAL
jgi:hypothetical protein